MASISFSITSLLLSGVEIALWCFASCYCLVWLAGTLRHGDHPRLHVHRYERGCIVQCLCELAFRGVLCLWPCVSEVKNALAETLQDRHVVSTDRDVEDVFVEGVREELEGTGEVACPT